MSLIALAFWAADGSWEIAGSGMRHWLLVKGSTVDRLGLDAVAGKPVRYVVRLGGGTDPGSTTAVYDSRALPEDIAEFYAGRCRALGIAVRKRTVAMDASQAAIVCAGDLAVASSEDVYVVAKRATGASATEVRIIAGPGLTGVSDF